MIVLAVNKVMKFTCHMFLNNTRIEHVKIKKKSINRIPKISTANSYLHSDLNTKIVDPPIDPMIRIGIRM